MILFFCKLKGFSKIIGEKKSFSKKTSQIFFKEMIYSSDDIINSYISVFFLIINLLKKTTLENFKIMEKTKFKLNYIHSHVKQSRLFKSSQKKRAKKYLEPTKFNLPLPLLRFYCPNIIYNVGGGFCFLDQVSLSDDYVRHSALVLNFMQIKEIQVTADFIFCKMEDSGEPNADIELLSKNLMSLGDQNCYDLATNIQRYSEKCKNLDIVGKKDLPEKQNEHDFFKALYEKQSEPLLIYHHKRDIVKGLVVAEIRVNKFMKEITSKNDLQLFQEGVLLIPCKEYFFYINELLKGCFQQKNYLFKFYLNTNHEALSVFSYIYQFEAENELITILSFPKKEQNSFVQKIYEEINKKINHKKYLEEPRNLPKKIQNMEDWDEIIKKYYESWLLKEGNVRCSYQTIVCDQ